MNAWSCCLQLFQQALIDSFSVPPVDSWAKFPGAVATNFLSRGKAVTVWSHQWVRREQDLNCQCLPHTAHMLCQRPFTPRVQTPSLVLVLKNTPSYEFLKTFFFKFLDSVFLQGWFCRRSQQLLLIFHIGRASE